MSSSITFGRRSSGQASQSSSTPCVGWGTSSATRIPMIRTLRTRLTVLHVAVLMLTLALFAVLSYQGLSRTLYRHHDDELAEQAADLAERLTSKPLTAESIRESFAGSAVGSRFLMVRDRRGELLYRDPILESLEPALGQHSVLI